jgi:hypothetical protein
MSGRRWVRRGLAEARRRLAEARLRPEAGMSMYELIVVMAISTMVLAMVVTVSTSVLRADGKNLAREVATGGARDVSTWLGEALSYASPEMTDDADPTAKKPTILLAEPNKLRFTTAMPPEGEAAAGQLSEVTIQLGKTCWTPEKDDPGVLHRCLRYPKSFDKVTKKPTFCAYKSAGCDEKLFHDMVVARGVKTDPKAGIFAYYLPKAGATETAAPELKATASVTTGLEDIRGVEFRVTVLGKSEGQKVEATVYKYFAMDKWSRI